MFESRQRYTKKSAQWTDFFVSKVLRASASEPGPALSLHWLLTALKAVGIFSVSRLIETLKLFLFGDAKLEARKQHE